METIKTTAFLGSTRILRRELETGGDLWLLRLQWKPTSQRWCEKLVRSKIIIIIIIIITRKNNNTTGGNKSETIGERRKIKKISRKGKKKFRQNKTFQNNLQNCGLCCPGWPHIKIEKSEKKDKYLDLARELKKLWNMKVTFLPIMIGALGTANEGLLKGLDDLEIRGQVETTTLLRTARILRRILGTWVDLLSFKLQWKTIS